MLAEWYFCCCINANPSDTESFLSILESLENPESDAQLLYLAYNELRHTEDRMQIYAVPAILKSLRRESFPAGLKKTIKHYFEDLTETLSEDLENSIRQLINLALSNQYPAKIIDVINSFVQESQALPERRLSPTPYLDLKEFLPETFLLAVLADRLESYERLVDELSAEVNKQHEESSPISLFLQSALEYRFGRMAFRLAVLIVSLTSIEYPDKLRSLIAKNEVSIAAQAEPDLLQTYAIVLFKESNTKDTTISQCHRIMQESLALSELRNLIWEVSSQSNRSLDTLFRRIGIQNTPNRAEGLPIFYWQIALWELSFQINASITADELVKFWSPGGVQKKLYINCSETDIQKQVESQFKSLLNLRGLHGEIQFTPSSAGDLVDSTRLRVSPPQRRGAPVVSDREGSKVEKKVRFNINSQHTWIFFSPWIERTKDTQNLYPMADEPVLLIRLVGSVFVAIRLLQKLAQEQFNKVEFAARLLVHASNVITIIERRYSKNKVPQLPPTLMGLLNFVKRQIKLAGTGQIESIDPENFVGICKRGAYLQEDRSNTNNEELLFLKSVLPEVLTSWVLDAYPGAVSLQLSGRWLRLIPDVYDYHNNRGVFHETRDQQAAALIIRFLHPHHFRRPEDRLNWKIIRSKKKPCWKVHARELLLTEKQLYPSEWIGVEWDDNRVDWGSDSSKISSNRLVYILELLDTIGHYLPNYDITLEELDQRFSEWKQCLNNVGHAKDLDRFIRLRLLEFLDSPILEDRAEEQILLASVLLEYGSIYDLKNMLEQVYPTEADGITFKQVKDARQELQLALLPMIWNHLELEQYTDLMREINDERDPLSLTRKAKPPREIHKQLRYIGLFKEWLIKLFCLSNIRENFNDFSGFSIDIKNLRRISLEKEASSIIRTIPVNVEIHNSQKLLIPLNDQSLADLAIRAINYSPNHLTAKIFYEDFDTTGVENLFEKVPTDIQTLSHEKNPPLNVLAIVLEIEQDDSSLWKYTFDCGFECLLTHSSERSLSFKLGDRVKLPIRQFREGDNLEWRVSSNSSIASLPHKSWTGSVNKIVVGESWKESRRTWWSLQRQIGKETQEIPNDENLRLWDANISRIFYQHSQTLSSSIFAKLNDSRKWIPLDLDFSDLLYQVFHSQQSSNIVILTLIEETIGQFGEKAWRFSRQPGENYLIEQHHFSVDAAATLADEIASYQNCRDGAVGLLISVAPEFESSRVRLKLVVNSINTALIDKFYPELNVPFDNRNIRWREIFAGSDERLIAEKNDHGYWFFYLPENLAIPGYPHQVQVEWHNVFPDGSQQIADLLVIKWEEYDWRRAVVMAETTPFHKINPLNQNWAAFLNRWLNLPNKTYMEAGERIQLERTLGWIDREGDGFVPCLTTENLRVWVQAESLTMIPLEHQSKPRIGGIREAEIFWIEWFEIQNHPEIKNVTILQNAIQNQKCVGIITQVPKSGTEGIQCQVVWQVSQGEIEQQGLQIDNLATLRVSQGDKIIGQQNHGKWSFRIEKPNIRVKALWSLEPWKSGKLGELYYLGTVVDYDGNNLEIAESKSSPGQLICLPHPPNENSHLAVGKEIQSKELKFRENSVWENNNTSNTARYKYAFDEPSFQYRRAVLKLNDKLLIGNCREWIGNEKITVQRIELFLSHRDSQKCVLRRRFDLRRIHDIKQKDRNSSSDLWKRRLEDYLRGSREPLRSTFAENKSELGFWLSRGGDNEIRIPQDSSGRDWGLWVPLAPDQGKFFMGGDYAEQARICLLPELGKIWASCRRVTPLTLEEFRVNYCEAPTPNTEVFLLRDKDICLYYVGSEEVNELTGKQYIEIHHRFEMGYGETLLIPESQLEFDDGLFSQAQFSLFHGDLIKVISLKKRQLEDNDDTLEDNVDSSPKFQDILNIKGIYLDWSEARIIYDQSNRYQIVHLLHLKPRKNEIDISYIDGFNDSTIVTQQRQFKPKSFKACLTSESESRLSNRLQKWVDYEDSKPVIFGRLDKDRFVSSHGKDIYFDHVRLSFEKSSKGSCLLNRDLVFLSASQIKLFKNDIGLILKAPKGFDPEDIGADATSLLVLRRNFSARENLLKQVYEEKGENSFQDDRLLIQLTRIGNGRITSRLLVQGDNAPSRKVSALANAISNLERGGLLATIVTAENRGIVQIEYKPGIFIRLKAEQIQSCSCDLSPGTIVRIEVFDKKLSITRAAFGNSQYIPEGIRPAVILPTNDIQGINLDSLASQGRFSIGNLPNVIARLGHYTNDRWENSWPSQIIVMMSRKHPKIACLGKDTSGKPRIALPSDSFPAGHLARLATNSLLVQYVLTGSEQHGLSNSNTPWYLLSFGDESAQKILDRVDTETWRYHDNETFTLVPDTTSFEVEKLRNSYHTVWTGPIFFQRLNEKLRLRYTQSEFRRFGFPVEELICVLKKRDKSHCYPVAGVSQFPECSLWIELVPGRLVELPVQLIVWRSGVNEKAKSLADLMHWQGFAPGDKIEIEIVSTDPLTIDRIALKNWIPGVRNAFGPNRCFLPVEAVDEQQGKMILGRGEFNLSLPFGDQNPRWQMVTLTPENDVQGITEGQFSDLKRDDVVLLSINNRDQIIVLGFESMIPIPDWREAEVWKEHPITGCLIRQGLQRLSLDSERLKSWIRAVGGALPVTVEGLHRNEHQNRLLFSMRYQQDAALIPPGCISSANFINLLSDGHTAMLRCGGGLIHLPMRQIIPGLDTLFYTIAAEQLKQAEVSFWLRRDQNSMIKVGFNDDSNNQELLVRSLDILLHKDSEGEIGLICQSITTRTLHWLPIQEAAWTNLSITEFRDVFKEKLPFKVRRKSISRKNRTGITTKASIISILSVLDVCAESKRLTIGQELFVQVVKRVETDDKNKQRYLVESLTTQVILECEIYDNQNLQPGETLPVEVIWHIKGSPELITVVPIGKKRKYLDLPTWMTETLPEPGVLRQSIQKYVRWRHSEQLVNNPSNDLDRFLCHCFNDAYGTTGTSYPQTGQNSDPEGQLRVAKQWDKQNRYKPEINAAFAIMAILLLNKYEETRNEAYELTQILGRRALRSLHIEVLYQQWLRIKNNRQRTDGLWRRLRQIETDRHLYIPLKDTSSDAIKQFCNAVEMKSDTNLLPIAKGLSAALGELTSITGLEHHAWITISLINIYLTFYPSPRVRRLHSCHTKEMQEILKKIDRNGFDIILLEPLNFNIDNYSTDLGESDFLAEFFMQEYVEHDWNSWLLQQIDHLEELTCETIALQEKAKSLKEKAKSLKDRFCKIYQIQGE
jgi:hypothetical protein